MRLFRAFATDVPRIEACARDCCAEHGEAVLGGVLDWAHYRDRLTDLLRRGLGAMWLYEDAGAIVAGFCGARYQVLLTGKWRAGQIFLYAKAAYRGRISIRKLFRLFESWAKGEGCEDVSMPLLESMPAKTGKFYERAGYHAREVSYRKALT